MQEIDTALNNKMSRIFSSTYILVLFTLIVALSCQKAVQDPITTSEVPSIQFKSIRNFHISDQIKVGPRERDSVAITISFQDSDDDLGEILPIDPVRNQTVFANQDWGNFQIKPLVNINGQYLDTNSDQYTKLFFAPVPSPILFFPRLKFKYSPAFIPFSFDSVAHTLTYNTSYATVPGSKKNQILPTKFLIKIRDRKLNESNVIETDTVHLLYYLK